MQLAFIDDSEEKQPRRAGLGHLVAVGGVVVPETAVAPYSIGLAGICQELGVPERTELKWSPGDGSWLKTREGSAVRTELRERMLTLAVDLGITSVAVVWDRGLVDWSVNEVQVEILRWVYERISMCLPADEVAVVIADEPGGDRRDQREWLAETLELTDHGTEYVTPDRVVLPIVTTHPITCRTCSSPTWWWARPRPRWPATATRLSSLRCSDSSLTRTLMATRVVRGSSCSRTTC